MRKIWFRISLLSTAVAVLMGCQSAQEMNRAPANTEEIEFDSAKVANLKWAAQNRILFQFPDSTFDDVALTQTLDSCKSLKNPAWADLVFSSLETLKKNPALQNKIHVVEIKRGSAAQAEISKDLDGLTYLVLSYVKNEKKTKVASAADIPCENKVATSIGDERTEISFTYPSSAVITKAVKDLPARTTPDRWNFKTDFLQFLASKMTIMRFSSELGFERSALGEFFLVQYLNEQADEMNNSNLTNVNYWLTEISHKSHSGSFLKIFALKPDKQLSYGMGASANSAGLAYPFVSYKSQDGKYSYTSLNQLNQCLDELALRYKRSIASIRSDYSTQSDTFLFPGYVCHLNKP